MPRTFLCLLFAAILPAACSRAGTPPAQGASAAPTLDVTSWTDKSELFMEHPPLVAGETIRFEVTTIGMNVHEFMVGPAADVAADKEGTPEVADVGMMQTPEPERKLLPVICLQPEV